VIRRIVVAFFAVAVLVIAGLGFAYKMNEFAMTIVKDDVEGFGVVAVAVYLVGMLPLLFLMLWAVMTGQFRNLERQKHRLFELDSDIERGGGMRYVVDSAVGRSR